MEKMPDLKKIFLIRILQMIVLFIIKMSFFIGIICAVIFSWKFLIISLIPFLYAFSLFLNIPLISPICRRLNWQQEKSLMLKAMSSPLLAFPLSLYLEMNPEPKDIYIHKGKREFALHIKEWLENLKGKVDEFSLLSNQIMQGQPNESIIEELKESQKNEPLQ